MRSHGYGVDTRKSKRINASAAVRWLGAYRKSQYSLYESIEFELNRCDEAAAEPLFRTPSGFTDSRARGYVGLLIKRTNIFRVFPKDCWSEYGKASLGQNPEKLYYTRIQQHSDHSECWVHMKNAVEGIVVYGHITCLHGKTQKQVKAAAKQFNLPIYMFAKGQFTLYTE